MKALTSGFTAALLLIAGCSTGPKATFTESTPLEELKPILLAAYPWATDLNYHNGYLPVSAQVREDSSGRTKVRDAVESTFYAWCKARQGNVYFSPRLDEHRQPKNGWSATVIQAFDSMQVAVKAVGQNFSGRSSFQVCEVHGQTYGQVLLDTDVAQKGEALNGNRHRGYAVSWLTPPDLLSQGLKATADLKKAETARVAAAAAARANEEARYADVARQNKDRLARAVEFSKKSPRGTQAVCTGRQLPDANLSEVYFNCTGKAEDIAGWQVDMFASHGWRIGSQTMNPILMTTGRHSHDVTVIFEKIRR